MTRNRTGSHLVCDAVCARPPALVGSLFTPYTYTVDEPRIVATQLTSTQKIHVYIYIYPSAELALPQLPDPTNQLTYRDPRHCWIVPSKL